MSEKNLVGIYTLGVELFDAQKYNEAIKNMEKYIAFVDDEDEYYKDAHRVLAESYPRVERFNDAKVAGKKYLDLSKSAMEIQRATTTLANIYSDNAMSHTCREDLKEKMAQKSRKYFMESIETIPADSSKVIKLQMESRSLSNLCRLESYFDNENELKKHFEKARKIAVNSDAFNLYLTMTQHAIEHGEEEQALSYLKGCSVELEKLRSEKACYEQWNSEATFENIRCHVSLQDYQRALQICANSLKRRTKLNLKEVKELRDIRHCLKKLYKRNKLLDNAVNSRQKSQIFEYMADLIDQKFNLKKKAVEFYNHALKFASKEDTNRLASLHYSIGAVFEEMRLWTKAKEHYRTESRLSEPSEATAMAILRCTVYCREATLEIPSRIQECVDVSIDASTKEKWKEILQAGPDSDQLMNMLHEEKDLPENLDLSDDSSDEDEVLQTNKEGTVPERSARVTTNKLGETKLQQLVKEPNNLEKVKDELRRKGYPVNHQDKCGYTALHDACVSQEVGYVKVLLEAGANVNVTSKDNVTPLMDACYVGDPEIIQLLLDHKANIKTREVKGWSAADYLAYSLTKSKDELRDTERDTLKALFKSIKHTLNRSKERQGILLNEGIETEMDGDDFFVDDFIEDSKSALPKKSSRRIEKKSMNHDKCPGGPISQDSIKEASKRKLPAAAMASSITSKEKLSFTKKRPSFIADTEDDFDIPSMSGVDVEKSENSSMPKRPRLSAEQPASTREVTAFKSLSMTEPNQPQSQCTNIPNGRSLSFQDDDQFSLVVKIESNTFRILIPKTATVEDLMKKSALRYLESLGKEPVLKLFDSFQAELHHNDKLAHIIQPNQPTIITSVVKEWIVPKVEETYLRQTNTGKIGIYLEGIYHSLKNIEAEGRFALDFYGTSNPNAIAPAIKSLHNCDGLKQFSLISCRLGLEKAVFSSFCDVLQSWKNIAVIDLSSNGLTKVHIRDLQSAIRKADWCPTLTSLKLSFNFLDDSISGPINQLLENCTSLSQLYLSSCQLTRTFSDNLSYRGLTKLSLLDLSYNRLGVQGIASILKHLQNSSSIKQLFIDGCAKQFREGDENELRQNITEFIENNRSLNLEKISITNNKKLGRMFPDLCPYIKSK